MVNERNRVNLIVPVCKWEGLSVIGTLRWNRDYIDQRLIELEMVSELLEAGCVQSRRAARLLTPHFTACLPLVYSEDGGWRRLVRKWMSVWHPGDKHSIPKPNLSLSLEDWDKSGLSVTLQRLSVSCSGVALWWSALEGESACMSGPQETRKSQFAERTVVMFLRRYSWSAAPLALTIPLPVAVSSFYLYFTHTRTHLWAPLRKYMLTSPLRPPTQAWIK